MVWHERFLSTSRGHILVALRRGPRTVDELALPLGLTRNAIRVWNGTPFPLRVTPRRLFLAHFGLVQPRCFDDHCL
jgi:hypothetical protein